MKRDAVTIFTIGDRADHDSYKKFHREKKFILGKGFEYASTNYGRLLSKGIPNINTKKVIVFLFFPFVYWNRHIERKRYRGLYGNRTFYKKFTIFWKDVNKKLRVSLRRKEVYFVNQPYLCGLYRDKQIVAGRFLRRGIPAPKRFAVSDAKELIDLLNRGKAFFLKPRYGSMGKGITFLSRASWQTNFVFKRGKIVNRRADRGWRFRDVTGNKKFLRKLLKKDILIEEAIDSFLFKKMKFDMRIYTFLDKVIYVYPRRNRADKVTTNISQGAKGDPGLLRELPQDLVDKAERLAVKVSKILGINMAGMDIMMDRKLKDVYVVDVNIFPGFPKRKTFNLARDMIKVLAGRPEGMSFRRLRKEKKEGQNNETCKRYR